MNTSLSTAAGMLTEDSDDGTVAMIQITIFGGPESSSLSPAGADYFKIVLFGSPVDGTSGNKVAKTVLNTSASNVSITPGM